MTKYMLNNEKNGVEVYFDGKPDSETIRTLKLLGFRWNPKKICWYAKQDKETLRFAEQLTNGEVEVEIEVKAVESILPEGIKFMWNGIKENGELHKAWYSMGSLRGYEAGTITIYADGYSSLPRLEGLTVQNDTDSMTDYFDKDKIRVTPDSKYYSIVKEAFDKQEEHRNRTAAKREAKRSAR